MAIRAYIIDFFQPGDVADAYRSFLHKGEMLLSTSDPLKLGERVRVRFNFPDGHGVVLSAKVVQEIPDQGFGLKLPKSDDADWLLEKARKHTDRLDKQEDRRKKKKAAEKRATAEAAAKGPEAPRKPKAEKTKPAAAKPKKKATPATETAKPKKSAAAAAAKPPKTVSPEVQGKVTQPIPRSAVGVKPPVPLKPTSTFIEEDSGPSDLGGDEELLPDSKAVQEMAADLAPSHDDLVLRVSKLDSWLTEQMAQKGGTSTIPVAPAPSAAAPSKASKKKKKEPAGTTGPVASKAKKKVHKLDDALAAKIEAKETIIIPQEAPPPPLTLEEKLKQLPIQQKKKMAISGAAKERKLLMKDEERSLQIWVLKNPDLTEEEVLLFSRMDTLAPDSLAFLLQSRKWATTPKIALNLALNELTPPESIPTLLAVLPSEILKKVTKATGVRHLVSRQARRIIMERGDS